MPASLLITKQILKKISHAHCKLQTFPNHAHFKITFGVSFFKICKKNHAVHICLEVGRRSNLLLNFRFKERGRYWAELLCSFICFSRLLHVFSIFLNFYKIPISLNNVFALKISQAILHIQTILNCCSLKHTLNILSLTGKHLKQTKLPLTIPRTISHHNTQYKNTLQYNTVQNTY